jgi:hypothetical protein
MTDQDDKNDAMSRAIERAKNAVGQKNGSGLELDDSPPGPAAQQQQPPDFGAIDLESGTDAPALELDESAKPAKPKPAIKKPALLQEEQWDDQGWAEGEAAGAATAPNAQARPAADPAAAANAQPQPAAATAPKEGPAAAADAQPQPAAAPAPKEGPFVRVSRAETSSRDWGPIIKIALIAILAAGLIGGGVWGFLKWQESAEAEEQAELEALDQGSLDSLKEQALKKEKLGA